MSVLFISGSPSRQPSRSAALLDYVSARLRAASVSSERLTIHDVPSDDLIHVRRDGIAAARLHELVERSPAVVIGTPVYNASVPGGLKALLDLLPEQALDGKPVLALASGGSAGHQLAIEYSLKPVLSALGARHVLAGVFASEGDVNWPSGSIDHPIFAPSLAHRLDEAIAALLDLLASRAASAGMWVAPFAARSEHGPVVPVGRSAISRPERCSA